MGQKGYHLLGPQFKGKSYLQKWVHRWVQKGLAVSELGDWLCDARKELLRREKAKNEVLPWKSRLASSPPRPRNIKHAVTTKSTRSSTPQRQEFVTRKVRNRSSSSSPQRPRTCPPRCVGTRAEWNCTNPVTTSPECTDQSVCKLAMPKRQFYHLRGVVDHTDVDETNQYTVTDQSYSMAMEKIQQNLHETIVNASWQLNALRGLQESQDEKNKLLNGRVTFSQDETMFSRPIENFHQQFAKASNHLRALQIQGDSSTRSDDLKDMFSANSGSDYSDSWAPENLKVNSTKTINVMPGNEWLEGHCGLRWCV